MPHTIRKAVSKLHLPTHSSSPPTTTTSSTTRPSPKPTRIYLDCTPPLFTTFLTADHSPIPLDHADPLPSPSSTLPPSRQLLITEQSQEIQELERKSEDTSSTIAVRSEKQVMLASKRPRKLEFSFCGEWNPGLRDRGPLDSHPPWLFVVAPRRVGRRMRKGVGG